MNSFLLRVLFIVTLAGTARAAAEPEPPTLITNARIVDGAGNPWYRGNLLIRGDRIEAVGPLVQSEAGRVIDAHHPGRDADAAAAARASHGHSGRHLGRCRRSFGRWPTGGYESAGTSQRHPEQRSVAQKLTAADPAGAVELLQLRNVGMDVS